MGVMECSRRGCANIMCERYSRTFGYICNECFNALVERGFVSVSEFMETPKSDKELPDIREQVRQHYEKIFPA